MKSCLSNYRGALPGFLCSRSGFARLQSRVFKFLLLQTLTNALTDPIHVMEMQIVPTLMVHSNAIAKLGFLEMEKCVQVYLDYVVKDLTLLTRSLDLPNAEKNSPILPSFYSIKSLTHSLFKHKL